VAAAPPSAPPSSPVLRAGWGLLAEVIRRDRPLEGPTGEALARYHVHLVEAGRAPAEALWAHLAERGVGALRLVDLGGGAGAYAGALLAARPDATATLVDRAEVLALAALDARARRVAADLLDERAVLPVGHDVALLSNVLHWYPAPSCARLVERAAAAVEPGGWVVVKDLRVGADRRGPPAGVLFALNMALYSDGGDVHEPEKVAAWLSAAGLRDVAVEPFGDEHVIVRGQRP
jgi:hypothetical protein